MRYGPLTLTLAVALAAGPLAASAQPYPSSPQNDAYQQNQQTYQENQQQYQQQQNDYNANDQDYQAQQQRYQDQRSDYSQQMADYQAKRDAYERARADYDARYGEGAYVRRYGEFRGYYTDYDGYAVYRDSPCEHKRNNAAAAGTVIGALAGAAIGSNLAAHAGGRLGGALLGGLVGGVAGNSIGRHTASCDANGYYYSYDETVPYAEDTTLYADRASGEHDYRWYREHRCRMAVAPVDRDGIVEDRYVRVCPDGDGRYRFTD